MKRNKENLGRRANALRSKGRLQEAEVIYEQLLHMDSCNVYALVGIGDIKRQQKRFEDAIRYYTRCLEIEKNNWYAHAGLGDAWRGLRNLENALRAWLHCLRLRPGDLKVLTRVADGLRKKGDRKGAREYYQMALQANPYDPFALMGLGLIAVEEDNKEEALTFFEKLIQTSSRPVIALTSAANIYRRRGDYPKAMTLYETALRIEPENSHVWHGKADCLRGMKAYLPAIDAWKAALKYGMDPSVGLTRIGDAYVQLDELDLAESSYQQALSMGYNKYAYLGISTVHEKRRHLNRALDILAMLQRKEPKDERISAAARLFVTQYPDVDSSIPLYS